MREIDTNEDHKFPGVTAPLSLTRNCFRVVGRRTEDLVGLHAGKRERGDSGQQCFCEWAQDEDTGGRF